MNYATPTLRAFAAFIIFGLLSLLAACGGGGGGAPTLSSISLAPATTTLSAGLTQQYIATGVYSDGSKKDVSSQATLTSSNTAIATTSGATVTAVASGTATITATVSGVSGKAALTVTAAALESIAITPTNPSLPAGVTQQLTAMGTFSDQSMQNLTNVVSWTSGNPSAATVSATAGATAAGSNGLVNAVAPGSAAITASYGGVTATTLVTVTHAAVASVVVTAAGGALPVGVQQQYTASATLTDGSRSDVTSAATWASSTPANATVGASTGVVTALAPGTSSISATVAGVSGAASVTVSTATLMSIAVSPATLTIAINTNAQLHATGTYSDITMHDITATAGWTSTVPAIATVSSSAPTEGQVTGAAVGTTTISASSSGAAGVPVTASVTVTVTPAALTSIAISVSNPNIYVAPGAGSTRQATAIGTFNDNSTQDLTTSVMWTSAAAGVATISNAPGSQGLIAGVSSGTTSISASLISSMSTPSPLTIRVIGAAYAYVASTVQGNVAAYQISSDGTLTPLTETAANPTAYPFSIAIHPNNAWVYVANFGTTTGTGNSVSEFQIGADGTLSPIGTGSIATGVKPNAVVVDPKGKFVYTANYGDGSVSQFGINQTDGSLTLLAADVLSGAGAASLAFDPSGAYLYVANYIDGTVSQFSIDQTTGLLTPQNPPPPAAGNGPNSIAVDPSGHMLIADDGSTLVSAFTVSNVNGAVSAAVPPNYISGANPFSVTFDPSYRFVYVANSGASPGTLASTAGSVSQYAIDATTGILTPLTVPTVAAGLTPSFVAVDPTGSFAFVANRGSGTRNDGTDSSLWSYSIGSDGSLSPNTVTAVTPAGKGSASIAITH